MSLSNGAQTDSDRTNKNGHPLTELNPKPNGNGINNNYDDYRMNKTLVAGDKIAEDHPLTGQRWHGPTEISKPQWTQRFASTNFFMVVFLSAYVLQGCYFTYFVSVITTLEKLFHIKTATIAMLLNFSEAGQICASLFLTYFAGRGHRPRWIACGMLLFSLAAFGSVSPHFMYGSKLYNQLAPSKEEFVSSNSLNSVPINSTVCLTQKAFDSLSVCNIDSLQDKSTSNIKSVVLVILAVSLLGIGIGQTAIATLGIPYIDDNVKSKQSPLYMAVTIGVRILGPALGYYLGSFFMRKYVDLSMTVDPTDPNFIGAWWLGLIFVSTSMFFASLVMFIFPKNLRNPTTPVQPQPSTKLDESSKTDKNGSGKLDESSAVKESFPTTIKRQLKNSILMFRTASAVLHLLPITALYVFLPKYLEQQFLMTTYNSTSVSGTFGILTMGLGIFITGIISVKFPLSARKVAAWIAFTAFATSLGLFLLSMIGCPMDNFKGLKETNNGQIFGSSKTFVPPCARNETCPCDSTTYAPVCGSDGFTYFSECHAGCRWSQVNGSDSNFSGKRNFTECSCIEDSADLKIAKSGECDTGKCNTQLYAFIAVFALTVFIHSTSEVGGMLLIMRCTHPKDKAMAMGIVQFSMSLFSNIPCPNIFGRIIDATCIVETKICGSEGYCSLYDSDSFRRNFFGVSSFIMFLAFLMDLVVFFKSHHIDIDPEANNVSNNESKGAAGEENLLKLRKMSHDIDEEHMKIAIRDEV